MTVTVVLDVPDHVYQQAQEAAEAEQRSIVEVLNEALAEIFPAVSIDPNRPTMEQETAAFWTMHQHLLEKHENQYVAISEGKVIDYDESQLALALRIQIDYPEKTILIKLVERKPEKVLQFRSPRWVS